MENRTTRRRHIPSGLLAGALLLGPLAACGDTAGSEEADAAPDVTATESAPAEETEGGGSTDTTQPEVTDGTPGPDEQVEGGDAEVDCSGNPCSVTLAGDGAEADVLGTSVVLGSVENGRATFRVGGQEVSCGQGESVSAGPVTLACSTVTEDTVTLTASLG
jgi:hypothetical protein